MVDVTPVTSSTLSRVLCTCAQDSLDLPQQKCRSRAPPAWTVSRDREFLGEGGSLSDRREARGPLAPPRDTQLFSLLVVNAQGRPKQRSLFGGRPTSGCGSGVLGRKVPFDKVSTFKCSAVQESVAFWTEIVEPTVMLQPRSIS